MSQKDRYGKFKKKDYVRIMESTVKLLCQEFGYKKKPYLLETKLRDDTLMGYMHKGKHSAIFYDYMRFKESFGDLDYDIQEAYASALTAHEMRHYYQHRQMIAKKPKEKDSVIKLWREDAMRVDNDDVSKYCLQPLELDAALYEYCFGADYFDFALLYSICNEAHLNAMEKLYVEYFGKTDEDLFGETIRKKVLARSNGCTSTTDDEK